MNVAIIPMLMMGYGLGVMTYDTFIGMVIVGASIIIHLALGLLKMKLKF